MKRIIAASLFIILLLLLPVIVIAEKPISVYLNGHKLVNDAPPFILKGSLLISMNTVTDLGFNITYDVLTRKINTVDEDLNNIDFIIDHLWAKVNGKSIKLDVAPVLTNGNAYIPLTFLANHSGIKLTWDSITKSVFLYKKLAGINEANEKDNPEAVRDERPEQSVPHTLTSIGSIQMVNDQLIIQANKEIPASKTLYYTKPDRIVVELPNSVFGVKLNGKNPTPNGEITSHHPLINRIRYTLLSNNPSTIRITVELNKKTSYSLYDNKSENQLVLMLDNTKYKVVIDPGHGGKDPGAEGASKKYEKEFTLNISRKVQNLLEKEPQIQTYLTRTTDIFISLKDRVGFATNLKADLFISLHGNTYESAKVNGTETYFYRADSKYIAETLHKKLVGAAGLSDRNIRKVGYRVIKDSTMPSALLEIGYLTNQKDESQMLREDFQQRIAIAIVAAIKEYFHLN